MGKELAREGAAGADADALLAAVHADMAILASSLLRRGERHVSLHTHDLVGEAVMRLLGARALEVDSEAHLKALIARAMRRVLVDAARKRAATKRAAPLVTLRTEEGELAGDAVELMRLDRALRRLKVLDPVKAEIVELRYFGCLSVEEVAEALGNSPSTVTRSWRAARSWLYDAMRSDPAEERS